MSLGKKTSIVLCSIIFIIMWVSCNIGIQSDQNVVPVTGVELDRDNIFILAGGNTGLSATVFPLDAGDKTVSWSSDNTDVASVGEDGSIHAVGPGEAIISVFADSGEFSDECRVQVLADEGFISIWDMSQTETNTLTLPLYPDIDHTFDFTVDWGDGTSETVTTETAAHTYAEEGIYAVVITGTCNGFGFSYANNEANEDNLVDILRWGEMKFHNYGYIFAGCDNLATFTAQDAPVLSGITNFGGMFSRAESFNADLSSWNTSDITDMAGMFARAPMFNGDISTWNTSNVTDMSSMFFQANAFNRDISAWDTSRVTDMNYMFRLAGAFSQDISAWDTAEVTNFSWIFSGIGFNPDISGWDTGNVEDMSGMFDGNNQFNQVISGWDVSGVTSMKGMFRYAGNYTNGGNPGGLNNWAVSEGCDTTNMFNNCPLTPMPDWYIEPVSVTGISLDNDQIALNIGDTHLLGATITPEEATNRNISFNSDAQSVATVDQDGLITALAVGTAVITVTTEDGGHTDSCTVTVQESTGYIVADHHAVDRYTDIPQEYIDIVKTWLVDAAGESHSEGYRTGVDSTTGLGSIDNRFAATTFTWGLPSATEQALRLGTHATVGEGDFWTNDTAKETIKDLIRQQHEGDNPIHVIFQAWCGDMVRTTGPAGAGTDGYDPVYGCHWLGSSVGGPDGNHIWGLDGEDFAITGNRISLQTYLDTIDEYNEYCQVNGYLTTAVFTTGPVDGGSATGEAGYQRYVKHQRIREYVMESDTRILFDYADILSYNDEGVPHTETWTSPYSTETYTFPAIHPSNDTEDTGHISYAGALRIGKAMWWLLARMAGWDGSTL